MKRIIFIRYLVVYLVVYLVKRWRVEGRGGVAVGVQVCCGGVAVGVAKHRPLRGRRPP